MYRIFEILDRVGDVTYRLAVPPNMAYVHNDFYISMLKKYEIDPSCILRHVVLNIEPEAT